MFLEIIFFNIFTDNRFKPFSWILKLNGLAYYQKNAETYIDINPMEPDSPFSGCSLQKRLR